MTAIYCEMRLITAQWGLRQCRSRAQTGARSAEVVLRPERAKLLVPTAALATPYKRAKPKPGQKQGDARRCKDMLNTAKYSDRDERGEEQDRYFAICR